RGPHSALHHLDRPGDRCERAVAVGRQLESTPSFEVAVHGGVDRRRTDALLQLHSDAHAVRHRRRHDAQQHGARLKADAIQTKLAEPAPPSLELARAFERSPYGVGWHTETE